MLGLNKENPRPLTNSAISDNDDNESTFSSSGKSSSIVQIDETTNNEHSDDCSTCSGSSSSLISDSEDAPKSAPADRPKNDDIDTEAGHSVKADKSEDELPLSELKNKLSKGKLYFKTTAYELIKQKWLRVFKCSSCDKTERSQHKINEHFRENHGPICCGTCSKHFNTVSAMCKHAYEHSEIVNKFPCNDCKKSYQFASQLKTHRKVHLTVLEHHCIKCTKSFKNWREQVKHQSVHSGKKWFCQEEGCRYSCSDPRNLQVHMHLHEDSTQYKCNRCGIGFSHYMQIKHHKAKPCINTNSAQG